MNTVKAKKTEKPVKPTATKTKSVDNVEVKPETKSKSVKKTKVVEKEPVVEDPEVEQSEVDEVVEEKISEDSTSKQRKIVNRETILEDFDSLVVSLESEIESLRQNTKAGGIKFLRSVTKTVKGLRANSARVMKKKVKTERKNTSNSGFLKPVNISQEMAKFTGWNPSEPRSRVDVTKYICDYIKENDLQNPEDRREIRPDQKLQKLLGLKNKEDANLKYYSLQTHLKKHFVKQE